jgi:hypothetical protein
VRYLAILLLLTGCVTPEQAATIGVGVGVGSIAVIQRSPLDALVSVVSGRDCSIVRWDQGKSYCRPVEPPPEPPPYCTRSLGVGDGPRTLTPLQDADRTKGWPKW